MDVLCVCSLSIIFANILYCVCLSLWLTVENVNSDGGGLCVGGPAGVLAAVRRLDGGDEQRGGGARGGLAAVAARRRGRQHGDPASRRRVVDGLENGGERIMIIASTKTIKCMFYK